MKLDKKYWIAIVCRFLVILTTFIITIFINRGLGVEKKGEYAYIINMVEMLYVIFSVGLGQTYATFKRSVGTGIQGTFIFLAYIHSALIIVLGTIYVWSTRNNYGLIIVLLTALAVEKVIVSMIAVIEESIKRNIIYTVLNVIYLMVLAVLYFAKLISLNLVLLCYAINDLLTIILYIKMYKMKPNIKYLSFDRLKSIYKMGIMTMIVMLLISVNYHVDTLMLKWLSNSYYIGIYSVGVNFSNMFLLIPDSFKEVLFGDSTKKNFSKETAIASIKVSLGASILILIGFLLFGKFAIRLFYGVDYIDSYQLTLILFIGCLFMTFFKILQPIYISHGSQTRVAVFLLCSAVANIVSNYFLIPKFNAVGAAVASAISYTICGVLFIMDYLKNFESDTQGTAWGGKDHELSIKNYIYAVRSLVEFSLLKIFKCKNFVFTKANLIFPLCTFEFEKNSQVKFGYKITMRRNTQITVRNNAILEIGSNCFFNANCLLTCHSNIKIGNDCKFGPGTMLFDHDHNMASEKSIVEKNNFTSADISIGEGCWFGANCIILKNTHIGAHCVFGAGTVVKGNYAPESIVVQKRTDYIRHFD